MFASAKKQILYHSFWTFNDTHLCAVLRHIRVLRKKCFVVISVGFDVFIIFQKFQKFLKKYSCLGSVGPYE